MALEFEQNIGVLDHFGKACAGATMDWRRRCTDELVSRIPIVLADMHLEDLPYRALVGSKSSINFRQLWLSEGGDSEEDDCCPSTANTETEFCDFRLPKMEWISIGTKERCYKDWRDRFCTKYPMYKTCSPFTIQGNQLVLRDHEQPETRTFLGMVASELSEATWNHLYETVWIGKREKADQFDGIMRIIDQGLIVDGECPFPAKPVILNWAAYIHGQAAADAGVKGAWGDVVLPVDDPNRPADAPADNIWRVYDQDGKCAAELDITGFNGIDILREWWRFVTGSWGVTVTSWFLAVGTEEYKCPAEVAACMPGCMHSDCRNLLVGDNRDAGRSERESAYIAGRYVGMHPYGVDIPMIQSDVLGQFGRVMFIPERHIDGEGQEASWLLWAWRNQQAENNLAFRDMPALREALGLMPGRISNFDGELYDGSPHTENFPQLNGLWESLAWDWRAATSNCDKVRWWVNGESMLIPQCPHLWLIIDGIGCDGVLSLPCENCTQGKPGLYDAVSCADAAAAPGYTSTIVIELDPTECTDAGYAVGDPIDYLTAWGTTYRGEVTAAACPTITVSFVNDMVTCATAGGGAGSQLRDAVG